jgi:hypothetical protein
VLLKRETKTVVADDVFIDFDAGQSAWWGPRRMGCVPAESQEEVRRKLAQWSQTG